MIARRRCWRSPRRLHARRFFAGQRHGDCCRSGPGEWLVGRSHECDNPPWVTELPVCTRPAFDVSMSSGRIDAEVQRRLKAGEPLYHVDTELINSLKPDLLITQEHCEVCAVTPADVKRAGSSPRFGCWRVFGLATCREFLTASSRSAALGPGRGCGESGRHIEKPHQRRPQRSQGPSCTESCRAGVDRSGVCDGQLGAGTRRGGQRPPRAG